MSRYSGKRGKFPVNCRTAAMIMGMVLLLSACGDGPGEPRPPYSPPRPMTSLGRVTTAQLELPARPVLPPPGEM